MHLPTPPPFYLLWSYRRRPPTTLNILQAGHAWRIWRGPQRRKIRRLTGRYLVWAVRFPLRLIAGAWRFGPAARAVFGRSIAGQIADMCRLTVNNDLKPSDYYRGGLARYGGGEEMYRYVSFRTYENNALLLWQHRRRQDKIGLGIDKLAFERACRSHRLPCVETIAEVDPNGASGEVPNPFHGNLSEPAVFLKPARGGQGKGAERWDLREGGYVKLGAADAPVTDVQLFEHTRTLARARRVPYLVQRVLVNAPDLRILVGDAIASARLVTIDGRDGRPVIVFSSLRMASSPDSPVDNYHSGGVACPVDAESGIVGPGMRLDFRRTLQTFVANPVTGARIEGVQLSEWPAVRELAIDLHRALASGVLMGWDIAMTPDGPIALEGGSLPGLSMASQTFIGGFIGSALAELMAWHVKRIVDEAEPEDSRFRVGAELRRGG